MGDAKLELEKTPATLRHRYHMKKNYHQNHTILYNLADRASNIARDPATPSFAAILRKLPSDPFGVSTLHLKIPELAVGTSTAARSVVYRSVKLGHCSVWQWRPWRSADHCTDKQRHSPRPTLTAVSQCLWRVIMGCCGRVDGWVGGWMDEWVDGWMGEWMGG